MYNPAYLALSRHNIYYFRFPIPKYLHPQGKSRYIRLSLGTRCPREALLLARTLFTFGDSVIQSPVVCDMEFYEIRTALTVRTPVQSFSKTSSSPRPTGA